MSLVAIIDADKEGFLRSHRSLTQTIGRAARHTDGKAIMYADKVTKSMQLTIDETNYRREKQSSYNKANNITPQPLNKSLDNVLTKNSVSAYHFEKKEKLAQEKEMEYLSLKELDKRISDRRKVMEKAAMDLDFISAAALRDEIKELQNQKKKL